MPRSLPRSPPRPADDDPALDPRPRRAAARLAAIALKRLASAALLVLLVLTATFFLVHLAPGDPARVLAGEGARAADLERVRAVYGLDKPLGVQYLAWLGAVLRGDWGTSLSWGRPAVDLVAQGLGPTALLALAALAIQFGLGIPIGVWAAQRRGGVVDGVLRTVSLTLYSTPSFWLALMAILLFSFAWPVLPASHMRSVDAASLGPIDRLLDLGRHLVLPALVLGLGAAGATMRFVRNQMLEVLSRDHIRTARAQGLSEARVVWVHGLRNALVPVIQLFGLSLPALLNGALIVEVVFSWPGLGYLTFQAILARDYPVILAMTAFTAVLVILGNLLADVLHAAVDPRVRRPAAPVRAGGDRG